MRKSWLICIWIILGGLGRMPAQIPIGQWEDHLPYAKATVVYPAGNQIFIATPFSLFTYDKQSYELRRISKIQGLSETGISAIAWNAETQSLIIAYESCVIDIVKNQQVFSLHDIERKYIPGIKKIRKIFSKGSNTYLVSTFGLLVLDTERMEISATWQTNDSGGYTDFLDVACVGEQVYALTTEGLYTGNPQTTDLSYFANWNQPSSTRYGSECKLLTASATHLFVYKDQENLNDSLLQISNSTTTAVAIPNFEGLSLRYAEGGIALSAGSAIQTFTTAGEPDLYIDSYGWGTPNARDAVYEQGTLWIADGSASLIEAFPKQQVFNGKAPPGPLNEHASQLVFENQKLWVAGGGVTNSWNNTFRNGEIYALENQQWQSILNYEVRDLVNVAPVPGEAGHFFAASWGHGLLEYRNAELINTYNQNNSPLESIIPGSDYSRIYGLQFDRDQNLWISQTGVNSSLKVLKSNGEWVLFPGTVAVPTIGELLITSLDHKWLVLPRGYGLYVLDDHNSLEDFSDDEEVRLSVNDQDGTPLNVIHSIAEDRDGDIWIGTSQGPAVFYTPSTVFQSSSTAYRIKIPRNDGTNLADYLLGNETITEITVDGANRKWLGTQSAGVFLVSPDGQEEIHHFTTDNSPLPSNRINAIAIDPESGLVYFGTEKGIVAFRAGATEGGSDFGMVYTFPNPVREDYRGPITITGLAENVNVKITTISGSLVYETTALGGQAQWDGTNGRGKRVSTGVYLAFCTNSDGSKTHVTKILFIH